MTTVFSGLSASLQSNALVLRQTQNLIDDVQKRLATGLRVDSAADGADNFFTASALSQRSSRLNTVLDNIIKNVTAVTETNNAVTSLKDLTEQAKTVAESAQEVFTSSTAQASITGNRALTSVTDLTDLAGIDNNDRLRIGFIDTNGAFNTTSTVVIGNNDSINDLIDGINAITDLSAAQVFEASLNTAGQLTITERNGQRFDIDFEDNGGNADPQLVTALGFGDFDTTTARSGLAQTRISVSPTPSLTSNGLFDGAAAATTSTLLFNLTNTQSGPANDIFAGDANDSFNISIDGAAAITVVADISTATVQDLVDGINDNSSLSSKIKATFTGTSQLNIRAVDETVQEIQFEIQEDGVPAGTAGKIDLQKLGFGFQVLQNSVDGSSVVSNETVLLGDGVATLASLENEFDTLRTQIDELVADAEFDNKNLLNGDDVTIILNETGSSSITSEGEVFTTTSTGISAANFGTSDSANAALAEIEDSLARVERFSEGLANDLAVIDTRQTFIEESITTFNAGAEDLVAADTNADGALLLALQTRQALGATALALGVQTQQSALRLF